MNVPDNLAVFCRVCRKWHYLIDMAKRESNWVCPDVSSSKIILWDVPKDVTL